ncbi:MAG TPA: hypothetical protein VGO92_05110 [Acidimicrobiales bacterium]|nr:hypothetical protein [Acidimicrobiales bacterium]
MTALAGAFAAGPASADSAEAYIGSAAARGLNVSVVNPVTPSQTVQATLGSATAKASSALTATATGVGQVLPELLSTTKTASASSAKASDNPAEGCAKSLPLLDIVNLGIACGDAEASVSGNLPTAVSSGSVAGLTVDGQTALTALDAATKPIGEALSGVLDTVCSTLSQTCPATTTVQDLVDSVLKTRTLDVSVGKSDASVVTTAGSITSTAHASGAIVKLLPLPQVNALPSTEPLATIEISSAKATAVYDRATGKTAEPVADPALVRVKFNSVLTQSLGVNEIAVAPDKEVPILEGTPLESRIYVASGKVVTNPDGTKGAVADGVKLRLLMGLGESSVGALDGGITLELAHAEAGVAGAPAVVTPVIPVVNTPDIARELPRTGGNPLLPMAGVVVLGLAVLVRRATVRAAASR